MSLTQSKSKSDAARAEGNTAFKKGRWSESIGHYTNAILHNADDPLAYGNRAQAYLKLEKYADAERDCTTALTKQSGNVKALYRRALARKGLEQYDAAVADLNALLKVEVGNTAALEELEEIGALRSKAQAAQAAKPKRPLSPPKPAQSPLPLSSNKPKPASLELIPSDDNETLPPDKVESKSFSSLKSSRAGKKSTFVPPVTPKAVSTDPSAMKVSSSSDSVVVPEKEPIHAPVSITDPTPAKTSAQSSAIPKDTPSPSAPVVVTSTSSPTPAPPTDPRSTATGTGILLLRALTPLPPQSGWALLRQYPPANVSVMLGPTLEPDSLSHILQALAVGAGAGSRQGVEDDIKEDREKVKIILQGLKTTPRFGMNTMMLDPAGAEAGETAWRKAGGQGSWP